MIIELKKELFEDYRMICFKKLMLRKGKYLIIIFI